VLLRAERSDGILDGLFIAVLTDADRLVQVLARVEAGAGLGDDLAQIAGQTVSVFEADLLGRGRTGRQQKRHCRGRKLDCLRPCLRKRGPQAGSGIKIRVTAKGHRRLTGS